MKRKYATIGTPFDNRWVGRVYMKKDHQSENSSGLEYADSIRKRVDIHFSKATETFRLF